MSIAAVAMAAALIAQHPGLYERTSGETTWRIDASGIRAARQRAGKVRPQPVRDIAGLLQPHWQPLGPTGGDIVAAAVSPIDVSLVLACLNPAGGGGGEVYRSTDSGETWQRLPDFGGMSIFDVAFAPNGTPYVGTLFGLYRGGLDALNWVEIDVLPFPTIASVLDISIDPTDPARIWLGLTNNGGGQPINVVRSINAGATWTDVTPPYPSPLNCEAISFHPTDPMKVYAGFSANFGGGDVWVSDDYGNTWTDRSSGLPDRPLLDIEHDGTRLLVTGGINFGGQFVGLYESPNEGATWTPMHDGSWPMVGINDLEVDPADTDRLFLASAGSGILTSDDGGATWFFGADGTAGMTVNSVRFSPSEALRIVVGASSFGVLQSADGGNSFMLTSEGISGVNAVWIAANPLNCDELAMAFQGLNDGGVFLSTDRGLSWNLEALPGTRYATVFFSPSGVLYAVSDGPTTVAPEALYRREGDGTWTHLGPDQGGVFESRLGPVLFSQLDPDVIFTAGSDFGVADFEPTVWWTDDAGTNWTKTYEGPEEFEQITDLLFASADEQILLGSFTDGSGTFTGGVVRAVDGGTKWNLSDIGLPVGAQCEDLAATTDDPPTIYVSDSDFDFGGIYVSTNNGESWQASGHDERTLNVVADHDNPGVLYKS